MLGLDKIIGTQMYTRSRVVRTTRADLAEQISECCDVFREHHSSVYA
jgi:hypothetical protein